MEWIVLLPRAMHEKTVRAPFGPRRWLGGAAPAFAPRTQCASPRIAQHSPRIAFEIVLADRDSAALRAELERAEAARLDITVAQPMTALEIKTRMDNGEKYPFYFHGERYVLARECGRYLCRNALGRVVESEGLPGESCVRIDHAPSFIAIAGLPAVATNHRMYIGGEPFALRIGPRPDESCADLNFRGFRTRAGQTLEGAKELDVYIAALQRALA